MRDYKPRAREAKRRPSGGTLIGIFIGLVLGLALAAGLALYMTNVPVPYVTRADKARATPPQADRALAETAVGPPLAAPCPPAGTCVGRITRVSRRLGLDSEIHSGQSRGTVR